MRRRRKTRRRRKSKRQSLVPKEKPSKKIQGQPRSLFFYYMCSVKLLLPYTDF
jgi:hypothetical protein